MLDKYQRKIDYMRISVTDLCNLRCRYCMPEGMTVPKVPMSEILTYEELAETAQAAADCGITKFKVTGGEPLARRGCSAFVGMLSLIPGVEQVTLTTNGVCLEQELPDLLAAGLKAVNISLDSLKPEVFREITGRDELPRVLSGIDAAVRSGIKVKINAVLQKGTNDGEWLDLIALTKDRPIDVRFIEMMPIGYGKKFPPVYNEEVKAWMRERWPEAYFDCSIHGNGPAEYLKIPGYMGSVGFISAIHGKFCDSCNRIRLTSTGKLKPCLCYGTEIDIRKIFRDNPGGDQAARAKRRELLAAAISRSVESKPQAHCFEKLAEISETRAMVQIGG